MKLVLVGIRNHVLNFHNRVQGLRARPSLLVHLLLNRECHVAGIPLVPPTFLIRHFFFSFKALSSVSIPLGILLPSAARDKPATQHILGKSAIP